MKYFPMIEARDDAFHRYNESVGSAAYKLGQFIRLPAVAFISLLYLLHKRSCACTDI